MAAVTVHSDSGAQENKACHCLHCFPSICHEVMRPVAIILVFWMLSFKPAFSVSSFTFIKRLFSSSSLSAIRVVLAAYLRLLIFLPAILIPVWASSSSLHDRPMNPRDEALSQRIWLYLKSWLTEKMAD